MMRGAKSGGGKPYENRAYKWGLQGLRELVPNNFSAVKGVFRALKHRNFALYFSGQCVTLIGSWIQQVALGWLIFEMTNSVFLLSVCVFLTQIPTLFLTPFSGFVSDRFDRRKILLTTQSLFMLQALLLAVLTFTGLIDIYAILAISLLFGTVVSFDAPARQSFYSQLVPHEDLGNAIALNSTVINGTRFVGPALGGLLIAHISVSLCFAINACGFMATIFALYIIKPRSRLKVGHDASMFATIRDGFSYVAHSVPIRAILSLLFVICFCGLPFTMLMPAFSKDVLGGDSRTLGALMSCIGLGALSAAFFLAARKSVFGLGKVITLSCALFGAGIMLASFVHDRHFAYIICVPIGFGMVATAASCNTVLQTLVEDSKRGRVMSIYTMCFFGIPPIGSLLQGYLSKFADIAYVSFGAGLICVLASLVFEYYRPTIRKHSRKIMAEKGIIIPEIARGLQSSNRRHIN